MAVATYKKDPEARLDYPIDWSEYLEDGDTIIDSSWSADTGLDVVSDSYTDTGTTVWLSGGEDGTVYEATNTIWTAGGRIDERTIRIKCRDK